MSRLHIQHVKSAQANKAPSADTINYGEIAINYNENSPAIYIKDNNNQIVEFKPLTSLTIDTALSTGSTNAVQNSAITTVILENEEITAAALTSLNDNKLDTTAQTVTSVTVNGSGNAVTNATFTNKALTLTKGNVVTGATGDTYVSATITDKKVTVAADVLTSINNNTASGSLVDSKAIVDYVKTQVTSSVNYKGATTDLPASAEVGDLYIASSQFTIDSGRTGDGVATTAETGDFIICRTSGTTGSKWDVIQKNVTGAVTTTAATLTDGNVIVGDGNQTVKASSYTIGKSVPSNAVFTDSATTKSGHYTPTTASTGDLTCGGTGYYLESIRLDSKKHVVSATTATTASLGIHDTATTETGHYNPTTTSSTVGTSGQYIETLALDSKKHVISATTGSWHDTATTETGHYTPSTAAIAVGETGSTASGNYIRGIKLDTKKHVIEVVTGTPINTDSATTEGGHYTPTGSTTTYTGTVTGITLDSKKHVVSVSTGSTITVDSAMSTGSTNPVQNKVITQTIIDNEEVTAAAINELNAKFDDYAPLTQMQNKLNISDETVTAVTINGSNTGNVISNATFSGKALTLTKGNIDVGVSGVTSSGSGNAITGYTYSNGTLTLKSGDVGGAQAVTSVTISGTGNVITSSSTFSNSALTLSKGYAVTTASTSGSGVVTGITLSSNTAVTAGATAIENLEHVSGVTISGSGNAITSAAFSDKKITLTKGNVVTSATTAGTGNVVTGLTVSNNTGITGNLGYAITTVTTSGMGNVITGYTSSNGTLTLQKGNIDAGGVTGTGVTAIVAISESDYEALQNKSATTLYIVTADE